MRLQKYFHPISNSLFGLFENAYFYLLFEFSDIGILHVCLYLTCKIETQIVAHVEYLCDNFQIQFFHWKSASYGKCLRSLSNNLKISLKPASKRWTVFIILRIFCCQLLLNHSQQQERSRYIFHQRQKNKRDFFHQNVESSSDGARKIFYISVILLSSVGSARVKTNEH